jgi:hypothetical protein
MPKPLSAAERIEMAQEALEMNVKGKSVIEIGEHLGITRKIASNLVHEELAKRSEHRGREPDREKAIAHYVQIIRAAWTGYQKCLPGTNQAIGYLNSIRQAQERIDKLTGVEAPMKFEDVTEAEVVWDDADSELLAIEAAH